MLADDRGVFFTTPHWNGYSAVLVRIPDLERIDRDELFELVAGAWLSRAQKRVAKAWLAEHGRRRSERERLAFVRRSALRRREELRDRHRPEPARRHLRRGSGRPPRRSPRASATTDARLVRRAAVVEDDDVARLELVEHAARRLLGRQAPSRPASRVPHLVDPPGRRRRRAHARRSAGTARASRSAARRASPLTISTARVVSSRISSSVQRLQIGMGDGVGRRPRARRRRVAARSARPRRRDCVAEDEERAAAAVTLELARRSAPSTATARRRTSARRPARRSRRASTRATTPSYGTAASTRTRLCQRTRARLRRADELMHRAAAVRSSNSRLSSSRTGATWT